jgi:hypothetical protein
MQASNVAPPQHSTLQKLALSMSSQAGTMSSKAIRLANRLCCPSRSINSLTAIVLGITVVRWVGDLAGAGQVSRCYLVFNSNISFVLRWHDYTLYASNKSKTQSSLSLVRPTSRLSHTGPRTLMRTSNATLY